MPASLIWAALAARTRRSSAQRFPEVAPEMGPGGDGLAGKWPQGTEGGRGVCARGRTRAGDITQAPWKNDPGVTAVCCLMGEAGEALQTDWESTASFRDWREACPELTLLQHSPLQSFFYPGYNRYLVRNTRGLFSVSLINNYMSNIMVSRLPDHQVPLATTYPITVTVHHLSKML